MPPSSPQRFSDTDDAGSSIGEIDAVPDVDEIEGKPVEDDDEDAEGEDLFGEAMEK